MSDTFSITNATRRVTPRVAFSSFKEKILGKKYVLSLVFVSDARMRTLNRTSRGKDMTTDILSYPLSKESGEIFISTQEAARRSKNFGLSPQDYLVFLFIHGCLHVKGYDHGGAMEALEKKWSRHFGIQIEK